ncbi:MAG: RNA polymerase sigma factor [candidate division Zixibacteria bacterium]|nr:RNA polymerase sigma factor [candidate division Zixibacteria bacterium]
MPSDPETGIRLLFEKYHATIYNLCLRILDQEQDAEDITQDVFVRAFKAYHQFRAESSPGTWLYRIAVNLCLNRQRRLKYVRWLSLDVFADAFDTPPFESPDPGPDAQTEQNETGHIVRRALHALPDRQRTVLIMTRYDGLSYREIARILACSKASVESLLHRAKLNLAKHLKPYLDEL